MFFFFLNVQHDNKNKLYLYLFGYLIYFYLVPSHCKVLDSGLEFRFARKDRVFTRKDHDFWCVLLDSCTHSEAHA